MDYTLIPKEYNHAFLKIELELGIVNISRFLYVTIPNHIFYFQFYLFKIFILYYWINIFCNDIIIMYNGG